MYLGFQGLCAVARLLPLSLARVVGRTVGLCAYGLLGAQRRLTLSHLQQAFGESLSPVHRRQIARNVFTNLGQSTMEWLVLPRLSSAQVQGMVSAEGVDHLRQALAKGNGAIAVTAHFGNWELISIYLRSLGFEGGVLARRLRYPEYESFLISMRGARGIHTIARGSLKDVAKLLRANHIIGMLPDQDIDSLDGIFVPFFGRPAYTPLGPAALSLMTGAPIVPCFMLPEGRTFRLIIEPPLLAPDEKDRAQALRHLTEAWSARIEAQIRRFPDHWVWMHRRWKTQPAASTPEHSSTAPARLNQPALALLLVTCHVLLVTVLSGCGQSTPKSKGPPQATFEEPTTSTSTAPSQQMSGFSLTGYQVDGSKRWDLAGEGASVDENIVTIHHPNAVGYEPTRKAYLTASVAQVNQANRHIRMEHNVTIHTSDGLWLTSSVLHWIPDQNQIATDQPVRIETDHMLIRGRGMSGLTELKQMTIPSDIEVVLNPTDHDALTTGPTQVTITCDGPLSFDYGHNIATFEQNVHVNDPNGDLYSDKLIAYLNEKTRTIRYAEAIGHVRIQQHQNTAFSERAVYEPAIGKMTLVGKPSLLVYPSEGNQDAQLSFGGLVSTKASSSSSPPTKTEAASSAEPHTGTTATP